MQKSQEQSFSIPTNLLDLEDSPHNLQPYPSDFDDDDEASRAQAFERILEKLDGGNEQLEKHGLSIFENGHWLDHDRLQNLYTVVRKSASLALKTRKRLISSICQCVHCICDILDTHKAEGKNSEGFSRTQPSQGGIECSHEEDSDASRYIVPQSLRDAFACYLYMLFNIMLFSEAEVKGLKKMSVTTSPTKKAKAGERKSMDLSPFRKTCAGAMLRAAKSMSVHRMKLWKRGVPDESVVSIPCRIAYQMLELATGVMERKTACGDEALNMIAASVASADTRFLNTVCTALLDLLHSYKHMAPLIAELCSMLPENPAHRLPFELLQEIGRFDYSGCSNTDVAGKASGVRNVAPFISELAALKPHIVLDNIIIILPLLDCDSYFLRSAIVTALGHIVVRKNEVNDIEYDVETNQNDDENEDNNSKDVPAEESVRRQGKEKVFNSLLDVLTERTHDKSSVTRVAVLKAWINLSSHDSIPLNRVIAVTTLAIDRLQDISVNVRKTSMQLLTSLLENNPFMESLDPIPYKEKADELYSFLLNNIPSNVLEETTEAALAIEKDENERLDEDQVRRSALAGILSESENSKERDDLSDEEVQYINKVAAFRFTSAALEFIQLFEDSHQTFKNMLHSANTFDVTEALRFFVKAKHFDLPCSVTGIKDALMLMWSTEAKIKDEVLKAFVDVFIAVPGTDGKKFLPDKKIARNLLVLAGSATVSEVASIEEAIGCLVKDDKIPEDVFLILWNVAQSASGDARSAAMSILTMGAKVNPDIVDSLTRLRLLYDAGLGEYAEEHRDWRTICAAACALQQIRTISRDSEGSAKALMLEQIEERLKIIASGDWCRDDDVNDTNRWFSAAEQAINAIFVISEDPTVVSGEIIRGMENSTLGFGKGNPQNMCNTLALARFVFVIGHVALKTLVYAEALGSAVRRAYSTKSLSKQENAKSGNKRASKGKSIDDNEEIEDELGMGAEVEAETERQIDDICENEIVGRGLLGMFSPLVVKVVKNEDGNFSYCVLRQSATLALCKLMCISCSFCEKNLPLLFHVLSNASIEETTLRVNIVVALGDLAFRFPNAVEPYTSFIYACLRDESDHVKRHTLMVLSHLILNDMVKVKGQVCEIALCLEDKESRIRGMARLLFNELSKRSNNPIYNLLPDIVSRLGQMETPKETFRKIMVFLLCFIKKEKQVETLVLKFCQRFPACTSVSQKADVAFCLSNLPKMNEKCIKLLNDNFKLYKDALFDEDVFKSFSLILSKSEKLQKPEVKDIIDELRGKLESENQFGIENEKAGNKADKAKARAAARKKKRN